MEKTTQKKRMFYGKDMDMWELKRAEIEVAIKVLESGTEYHTSLAGFVPEVFKPSGMSGNPVLNVPFIVVSDDKPGELKNEWKGGGSYDYVIKGRWQRLPVVILNAVQKLERKSEQMKGKQRNNETEPWCHDLIRQVPIAIYTCQASGEILLYNKAMIKLWGREPEIEKEKWCGAWKIYDLKGNPVLPEDRPAARATRGGKNIYGEELTVEQPDGTIRNVVSYAFLNYNHEGNVTSVTNILTDVTDQKKAEQTALLLAERLQHKKRTIGQFTYIISHILRAPIARILGLTSLFGVNQLENKFITDKISEEAANLDVVVKEINTLLSTLSEE